MKYPIIPYNPILKDRARELRNNMTPSEKILWAQLKGKQMLGCDFDRQRPINQFIVDFYCKALKLVIEVDGSCHDSPEAQQKDRERQAILESFGIHVLRFRNEEIHNHLDNVLTTICHWIQNNSSAPLRDSDPPPGRG